MPAAKIRIDERRALAHLMDLLAVEGLSGREGRVAKLVREKLLAAGAKSSWIRHDRAHERIPHDFEVGNLIVKLPGTRRGDRRLFASHLDTVPLCRGAVPVKRGRRIVAKGPTALGGDNRTAVACLVTLVEELLSRKMPHAPLTCLFTVGEEIGLWGARFVEPEDLGDPVVGFNYDSGDPDRLVVGAVSADRWEVDVFGRSSHAGVHPEDGVSAILIASRAIADVAARGYFGRVVDGKRRGTSNVGIVRGGEATNQVTDRVFVKGESRSHQRAFAGAITRVYRQAFERAARGVKSASKATGRIEFRAERDYEAFRLRPTSPVVRQAVRAIESLGRSATLDISNGGLDANWLNAQGIPTVTCGAGQHGAHTVDEHVDVGEFLGGCRLALAIATDSA